eukprot:943803_1
MDVSERTLSIDRLKVFWNANKQRLPVLSDVSQQWLMALVTNRKCIIQMFAKFHDNAQFEKHMQIFGASDPIQQTRAISLTKVRNLIVDFLNRNFDTLFYMQNQVIGLAKN